VTEQDLDFFVLAQQSEIHEDETQEDATATEERFDQIQAQLEEIQKTLIRNQLNNSIQKRMEKLEIRVSKNKDKSTFIDSPLKV
jgi:hypothetical protein